MSDDKPERPNCYECKHRGTVPGSAHISCQHPVFKEALDDPLMKVNSIFASVGRVSQIDVVSDEVVVKGKPQGIKNGWFNHPFNFDPVWLEECNGFAQKDLVE